MAAQVKSKKVVKKSGSKTKKVIRSITKNCPKPVIKRTTKKAAVIPTIDFFQAYEQALENPEIKTIAHCPVNPEVAVWLLTINVKNRGITQSKVDQFCNQMLRDEWWEKEDGDILRIDSNGSLMDGQHRLYSIIASGLTQTMMFLFNVSPESFITLNTGKIRNVPDILSILGYRNSTTLGRAINLLQRMEMGEIDSSVNVTNAEAVRVLDRHPGILESILIVSKVKGKKLISVANLAFLHYAFSQKNQRQADKFVKSLISGEGLVYGSPIYTLRERLIRAKTSGAKAHGLTSIQMIALSIKTWNAVRSGKEFMRTLSWGRKKEAFPKIK